MKPEDREALWRVLEARRDHRHFRTDPVDDAALLRILDAFRVAPSVGLSQPWHVTVVRNAALRQTVYDSFAGVRAREQERFQGERRALYSTLKLEGIREAPVGLVVSFVPPVQATLGTTSLPAALEYSVVSAITLAWLAATAEGLGLGWVSLVEPGAVHEALGLAPHLRPLAYLCLGHPALDLHEPLLQTVGWAERRPLALDWRD
ncbi:5,6-dimethylbenzimidazole synthase [Deinococcus hohokamensis]|uniref:5,6-dimethylbenzimidazole synthase n=1 Tax=Deinococcus hohokamensis TaxID=309883 RepID=A0ABV9I7B8_9DEIO